jgi:hypothetical protein
MSEKEKRKNDEGEAIRPYELTNFERVLIFAGFWVFLVFTLPCSSLFFTVAYILYNQYNPTLFTLAMIVSLVVAVLIDLAILSAIVNFGKSLDRAARKQEKNKPKFADWE